MQKNLLFRWVIVLILLSIIVAVLYCILSYTSQDSPPQTVLQQNNKAVDQTNQESSDPNKANSPLTEASVDRDVITTPKPNLEISINEIKQSSGYLTAGTIIKPRVTGTCTLELSRLGYTKVSASSEIIDATLESSKCEKLLASTTNLSEGQWNLTVKINTSSGIATSSTSVNINN